MAEVEAQVDGGVESPSDVWSGRREPRDVPDSEWVPRLSQPGPGRDQTVALLHELMVRAARHQVDRMPESAALGVARRHEVVHAAADEATVSVLTRLGTFEGRSKFTTWAYKFGILHAGVEVRRVAWRGREIDLDSIPEPSAPGPTPEGHAEGHDLAHAVQQGLDEALTPHQRRIAVALLVDEVPIDVLAERLGTTRSALYKTLHDARKRLRVFLFEQGYLNPPSPKDATP
jgi:RNA polymerase sigma-70 factor (ECF subfamily)